MGLDGVEKFVATPELQSEDGIGPDPIEHGQVWAISPGGQDEAAGLYRIELVLWRNTLDILATRACRIRLLKPGSERTALASLGIMEIISFPVCLTR
jgi:hypothetical protein